MQRKHTFLSYCEENRDLVRQLRDDLELHGVDVWWDQDILPGQDWRLEIRTALQDAYKVVLCLSDELENRVRSGVFPEVYEAIRIFRDHPPGNVFLIPVRLSDCQIPSIEIDATRTLDYLKHVDLFPESRRLQGVKDLVKALQTHRNTQTAIP